MKLLVTMGHHTCDGEESFLFNKGGVLLIDWDRKKILKELIYVSPPGQQAMRGRMLFHSGQLIGSRLVVATSSEVVYVDVDAWKVEKVITHPWFNDLHHAILAGEHLYVCNTGLQAVHKMTPDGEMLETWSVTDRDVWETYDPAVDYRPLNTKPHDAHPNHLFFLNGKLWATRCQMRDAVQVHDRSRRMNIQVGLPHDGNPTKDLVYFTTINGYIMGMCPDTGEAGKAIDLNSLDPARGQLGWCRGVRHIGEDTAFVGFSQFRPSKHKDFVHWILRDGKALLPSRIALYDLKTPRLIEEMPLSGKLEGAALYSIFALD
jgi:hypothetical protein